MWQTMRRSRVGKCAYPKTLVMHLLTCLACLQTMAYSATADQRSWQALRFYLLDLFSYVTPQNQYANTTVFDTSSSFA